MYQMWSVWNAVLSGVSFSRSNVSENTPVTNHEFAGRIFSRLARDGNYLPGHQSWPKTIMPHTPSTQYRHAPPSSIGNERRREIFTTPSKRTCAHGARFSTDSGKAEADPGLLPTTLVSNLATPCGSLAITFSLILAARVAGGALTLAFVRGADEGPTIVRGFDLEQPGDDDDEEAVELSERVSNGGVADGGVTDGKHAYANANGNSNGNGKNPMAAALSPGPSRENTPVKNKRNGEAMYRMVDVGNEYGMFGDGEGFWHPEGVSGAAGKEGYRSTTGRTGDVEGQMETGDDAGWDGDSDSDEDVERRRSHLVEPPPGATSMALV